MEITSEQLDRICRIAYEHSSFGSGKSLNALRKECEYATIRPFLNQDLIAAHLAKHPEMIQQWERFSEDKRTDGGWSFSTSYGGARISRHERIEGKLTVIASEHDPSVFYGCAAYILNEMDFWESVSKPA